MRTPLAIALSLACLASAACVAGNPTIGDPLLDDDGGSIVPPGCAHTVVTRAGAQAPALATDQVGADPTVKHVHLGLGGDPRTTIAVTWRTADDDTRAGKVVYGAPGGALDREAAGLTFAYRAGFTGDGQLVLVHEAHLCGLAPDTEYSYQIVSGPAHTSPVYRFRTAPDVVATPDAEVIVAAVGDSRDGYQVWAQLVDELVERTPDLLLFSGDAVTFGQLQPEWEEFFAVGEPLFAQVPVVSVHGNHDLNSINFYAQFAMPGDEENFSFDYGHAHITVVNDSPEQLADLSGSTKAFLQNDLAAHAGARWKIVNHHRPVYSASLRHGSDTTLRAEWAPVFDQAQVDLVLNGHDHDYERSRPMRGDEVQASPADGTVYIVSGGAGAELYKNGTDFWTQVSASLHSAITLRVRRELTEMNAFDQMGSPVDSFTINK